MFLTFKNKREIQSNPKHLKILIVFLRYSTIYFIIFNKTGLASSCLAVSWLIYLQVPLNDDWKTWEKILINSIRESSSKIIASKRQDLVLGICNLRLFALRNKKKLTWHSNLVSDLEICRKDPGLIGRLTFESVRNSDWY